MSRTQRQTNSSMPVMHYFTPASFFAATTADNRPINVKSELNAMTTPKRPPKLMDQRILISTNDRRNSQQQELMSVQTITPARGAIAVPQPIKQQHPRNQLQTMGQGKGAISAKLKETTPMDTSATVVFVTPPRRNASTAHSQHRMQQHTIRHEHTASIVIPSRRTLSATFMRYTPPTTFSVEGGNEVATLYAGSKFIESPSAKSLPLPPSDWLETNRQLTKQKIVEETVQTMSEELVVAEKPVFAAPSTESNNENFIPGTWSPPATVSTNKSPSGIRMHPLNLISAAVMSL